MTGSVSRARAGKLETVGGVPRRPSAAGRRRCARARARAEPRAPAAAAWSRPCGTAPSAARLRSMKPVSNSPARKSRRAAERGEEAALLRGPATTVAPSASASRSSASSRVGAMRDHLGDHRIVEGRHLAARLDAGIDAHALACGKFAAPPACRSTAGSRARDPRHKAAPRPRGRRARTSSCVSGSFSPAATRNCHSTRSSPVIASVTGCSTCSRVFISMNQKPSARRPCAPSAMNSTVPAPDIADRRAASTAARAHRGAHLRASCRAPAPPRSPSGGGAAASSRAR